MASVTAPDHIRRVAALLVFALVGSACAPAANVAPSSATSAPRRPPAVTTPSQPGVPGATTSPTLEPAPRTSIIPGSVNRSSLALSATYRVGLDVAVQRGVIAVQADIVARNDSGDPIDRLELNTIAARLGGLRVTSASVDDQTVTVTIDDQTLLVPLGGVLPDGASTTVRIGYTATLSPGVDGSSWLFTRAGGTLALYRWIPWVSRAVPFGRPNNGDPFITPSSPQVVVTATTDMPMILAAPAAFAGEDDRTWSFELRDVRDVALVFAADFEIATGDVNGIAVRAFTRPGGLDGVRLVDQAVSALTKMADRLDVAYPWPAFTIVETSDGFGMESPGLIWIPSDTAPANLPYLVHHETAHQWFYGLVGSDQQAEPFADEAVADLLARTVLGTLRGSRCDRAPLDRAITRYSSACYYETVYIQGAGVLDDLREEMGEDRFWAALRDYVQANRFGLAGTRQLLEALRAASPVDLLPMLRGRFPSLY